MPQGAFMVYILLFMFFIFITARGELPVWFSLLLWTPEKQKDTSQAQVAPQMRRSNIFDVLGGKVGPLEFLMGKPVPLGADVISKENLGQYICPGGGSVLTCYTGKLFNTPTGQEYFGGGPPV